MGGADGRGDGAGGDAAGPGRGGAGGQPVSRIPGRASRHGAVDGALSALADGAGIAGQLGHLLSVCGGALARAPGATATADDPVGGPAPWPGGAGRFLLCRVVGGSDCGPAPAAVCLLTDALA